MDIALIVVVMVMYGFVKVVVYRNVLIVSHIEKQQVDIVMIVIRRRNE